MKSQADKGRHDVNFEIGDYVLEATQVYATLRRSMPLHQART